MFSPMRTFLCLAVSLTVAGAHAARDSNSPKPGSQEVKPRPAEEPEEEMVVIAPPKPKSRKTRQVGQVTVDYYGPQGETVNATVNLPKVYRRRGHTVDFTLLVVADAGEVSKPDSVHVSFNTDGAPFKADRLVLEADGKEFSFGIPPKWQSVDIDFPSFEQIARSKSVKGRLGRLTFELTESHIEALRDLVRAFETPTQNR
jgi:hypothetical protein